MAGSHQWVHVDNGSLPEGAVRCGMDKDNTKLYVGRANHAGDLLPAKISHSGDKYVAYVSYGGEEFKLDVFEVLVGTGVAFMNSKNGEIPINALVVGHTATGENLYYGRTYWDGTITPGKIHPTHKVLYFPYGGQEHQVKEYEILIFL